MPSKPPTLAQLRAMIRRDTEIITTATARRDERLKQARAMGATAVELGADIGRTPGRVSHIAPKVKEPKGPKEPKGATAELVPARNDSPAAAPLADDELPERFRPGQLRKIKALLSDVVTNRWARDQDERATIFVHVDSGEWWSPAGRSGRIVWDEYSANELLTQLPAAVERVYLVGPRRPGTTAEAVRLAGSEADAVKAWFLADVPGWTAAGHYLADDKEPVGQWKHNATERAVEVARASKWFGEGDYGPADAARAWAALRAMVSTEFPGAILMSSPATTGRDMWRRTIGKSRDGKLKTFPVLSDELRQLIQSTSGQGRREILPGAGQVPVFAHYDMRFAYAALTWGMPVGEPVRVTGAMWSAMPDAVQESTLKRRGRWLVRATVPGGWDHVGILPAPADGGGWTYPRTPGQTFTTWASASEVELARKHQWRVDILDGMHWTDGKPLQTWRDKLVKLHSACEAPDPWAVEAPVTAGLCRAAIRLMMLTAIGAFASRTHMVSKSLPVSAGPDAPPNNVPVSEVDGMYVWEERGKISDWSKRLQHPEWSAEIWARCRVRLLDCPTGTPAVRAGALHVPAGTVIGMRTDALYLAGDPGWPDDGEPGRYRLKSRAENVEWPATEGELSRLKSQAEGGPA